MYLGTMVEFADSEELYAHPLHPYTQVLLSSIPVADPRLVREKKRIMVKGEIPSPINRGLLPFCREMSVCDGGVQGEAAGTPGSDAGAFCGLSYGKVN